MNTFRQARVTQETVVDSILWLLIPLGALWWLQIGGLSGDGVGQSLMYTRSAWTINPNHLLYEPIGATWLSMSHATGIAAIGELKRLSFLGGSLSLALFRLLLASRICNNRLEGNLATAWVIAPAAVLGLFLSDEAQIVQLPSLVVLAAAILHCAQSATWRRAVLVGAAGGVAALFYMSNVVICFAATVTLAGVLASRGKRSDATRTLIGSALGGAAVTGPVMVSVWLVFAPHALSFGHWITSYGGGKAVPVGAAGYGIRFSAGGLGIAVLRAGYGSATALVDVSGAVSSIHSFGQIGAESLASVAALLLGVGAVAAMLFSAFRQKDPSMMVWLFPLVIGWTAGVLAFAIYWNNSDDQFFFQLAIPLAVTAAAAMRVRVVPALIGLGCLLAWNGYATVWNYVTYPRDEYIAALTQEANNANLIIFPGDDDIGALLTFVSKAPGHQRIGVTALADHLPAGRGIPMLGDSVAQVLQLGGAVSVLSIIDTPIDQNPWKYLGSLGYRHALINQALTRFGTLCPAIMLGPWQSRRLLPARENVSTCFASPGGAPIHR